MGKSYSGPLQFYAGLWIAPSDFSDAIQTAAIGLTDERPEFRDPTDDMPFPAVGIMSRNLSSFEGTDLYVCRMQLPGSVVIAEVVR